MWVRSARDRAGGDLHDVDSRHTACTMRCASHVVVWGRSPAMKNGSLSSLFAPPSLPRPNLLDEPGRLPAEFAEAAVELYRLGLVKRPRPPLPGHSRAKASHETPRRYLFG